MSEYVIKIGPIQGEAKLSFNMMAGQGEGSYASPTSTDVGLPQTDEVGLTHFPKTKTGGKLPLNRCKITDQDFEDALQQLEPLLAEQEQRPQPFRVESIYGTHQRYVAGSNKRRKLFGDLHKPLPQKLPSAPVIRPGSVSSPGWVAQDHADKFSKPVIGLTPSEPVLFHYKSQEYDDESPRRKTLELCLPAAVGSANGLQEMQVDLEIASLKEQKEGESVEAVDASSGAFEISQRIPVNCQGITTLASNCSGSEKNLKDPNRLFQNDSHSEIYTNKFDRLKSADTANSCQRTDLGDPDILLKSVEKENETLNVTCRTDTHKSRSLHNADSTIYGVPKGLSWSPYQTIGGGVGGAAQEAANRTTQKFVLPQNSVESSRELSQTSTLGQIARLFLQNSLEASSEDYFKALSSYQIPAELRQYLQALLRKFHTDEQFYKAVITYTMKQTGALPPNEGALRLVPPKLLEGFDAVRKRVLTDKRFKMSIEKFTMEYLRDMKAGEVSDIMEDDLDKLAEKMKHKENLDELSRNDLTEYCRSLEVRLANFGTNLRSVRDKARTLDGNRPNHRILSTPIPKDGKWTCFHPQTTRASGTKNDDCGGVTPFYSKKLVWMENTICTLCKAPYDETLVSHHKKRGGKGQNSGLQSASPTTAAMPGSLTNTQAIHQTNTEACAQAYHASKSPIDLSSNTPINDSRASLTVHESLPCDASTGHIYGTLPTHSHSNAYYQPTGRYSDNESVSQTPISDRFHMSPMSGSPLTIHGGLTDYRTGYMSSPQTPSIGHMDALQIDMNFTGQDGEFDEFIRQTGSDRHLGIDSLFGEAEQSLDTQGTQHFQEHGYMPQMEFRQSLPDSTQHSNHYPAQLNLFPTPTGVNFQNQALPSSPPLWAVDGNLSRGPSYESLSTSNQYYRNNGDLAPPQIEQMNNLFQSPSTRQFTNSGFIDSLGTQHSSQWSSSIYLPALGSEIANSTDLYTHPRGIASQSTGQSDIQTSPSTFASNLPVSQTYPDIIIIDTDSEHPLNENLDEHPEYVAPQPPSKGRRRGRSSKVKNTGPGQGNGPSTHGDSSPKKKRASPMKAKAPQQKRRPGAAPAKEATLSSVTKTPKPDKPLSKSRLAEVQASNSTSAMFLGGTRKSWEERTPQGATADQDELDEALNAEFDRLDRAVALEVDECCENGETGGDDESRHSDRVIAVAAAPAVAEESEESEEE